MARALRAGWIWLAVSACSVLTPPGPTLPGIEPRVVRPLPVRFYPQVELLCGASSLAMALEWSGDPVSPGELAPSTFTPGRGGALQTDVISAVRRRGRIAYPVRDLRSLFQELAFGTPVVVLQNLGVAWIPRWHYAVVIAYDLDRGTITLHTGVHPSREMALATFVRTWDRGGDWGIVIVSPDQLPASADEIPYLDQVLGLQEAGQAAEAERAYNVAALRWPRSALTWLALGNARYRRGAPADAEFAYRKAIEIDAKLGAAFNNLAHLLAVEGRREEALEYALRAVALRGPNESAARRTLDAIRADEVTP